MQIVNQNLNLPSRKDEEFLKVDFEKFFNNDFKTVKTNEFNLKNLQTVKNEKLFKSTLFDIVDNFCDETKVLKIKENLKEPIIIVHNQNQNDSLNINYLKIELEKDVKATVIEIFTANTSQSYLVNCNLVLEENSSLEYVRVQDLSKNSYALFNTNSNCKANSNLDIFNFELGFSTSINSFENSINEENISYTINGLNKLEDNSSNATLIRTTHNEKNSSSSINYKNSLKDFSKAVVKIKSIVNETAPFSKAFQNCNTILLSDDATIFAQPHLEIYIDELEASHGTTTGSLNKEQLYYLCARGIPKKQAYDMLLSAFESSIKDSIKDENLKKIVQEYRKEDYV